MIEERSILDRFVDAVIWLALGLAALSCVLPIVHVIAISLSARAPVTANLVGLWPIGFHLENYAFLINDKAFVRSFIVSVVRVVSGVALNLLVVVISAYPLSRDRLYMPGRTLLKFGLLFGMLFDGGLIPYYLALKNLGLLGKFAVLIIPGALNIFLAILVINFFRGIPSELWEAAVLDGANHLDVLFRIFLPISTPSLATVALFSALGHWNSWFDGYVFLSGTEQWPLQTYLYDRITKRMLQWSTESGASKGSRYFLDATPEGLAAAMILIAAIPIMLVYPFLQRYFVTGLTLGSVKQ